MKTSAMISFTHVAARMTEAGMRMSELMVASNYVIGMRVGLMKTAAHKPLDADYNELSRMVPEKMAAFSSSGQALFKGCWAVQREFVDHVTDLGMLFLKPPTPSRLCKLADRSAQRGARALMWPINAGDAALAPVHSAATANAKRLRERH